MQVRGLWAADGQKGGRAARKRALSEYLKTLQGLGAPSALAAMPLFLNECFA